ncbi:Heterokaryon incompatibility protein (HET) domain containing protein [Rhypophila decipiens]
MAHDNNGFLCSRCEDLRLTPESFKVSESEQNGLRTPENLVSGRLASGAVPIRYAMCKISSTNNPCNLCSLIQNTIASYQKKGESQVTEYFIEWDLDGPYVKDRSKFTSTYRRLKVSWIRRMGIVEQDHNKGKGDGTVDNAKVLEEEIYLLAASKLPQQLTGHSESSADVQPGSAKPLAPNETIILDWLRMCDTEHPNPHPLTQGKWKGQFAELVESGYFGVIDVVDKRLCKLPIVENGEHAPYVALSYVWGKKKTCEVLHTTNGNTVPTTEDTGVEKYRQGFYTTSGNVLSRTEDRGLEKDWQDFPKTIRDALKLVRDLGRKRKEEEDGKNKPELRYIWIDSLCIVQDRPRSWNCNAKHMHLIYGNALFTICAADGKDSDAGLQALHLESHQQPPYAQITPDMGIRVFKSSESLINASEWNQRGWTYQEYILSSRCLLFTGAQIYFQCRQANWSQDDDPREVEHGMASAWRVLLHRSYEELESKAIQFFITAVHTYTGRNLAFAHDILNAFSGVSRLMEHYLCSHFHFGLPASHFDLALLWKPLAGKSRRKNLQPRHEEDAVEFPSWCWSGWMDSTNPGNGARVVYDSGFLSGCLADIRDWLLNHTWIIWYVRDQEGKLVPLWKGPTVPPSSRERVDARWQGYKSRPRGQSSGWVRYLDVPENVATGAGVDDYGRPLRDFWWHSLACSQSPHSFKQRLPDNPFGVRGPVHNQTREYMFFSDHNSRSDNYMSFSDLMPHQPHRSWQPILQFWTLSCDFRILPDGRNPVKDHLQRFDVADRTLDKCGTVVVDSTWAENRKETRDYSPLKLIALSEAKRYTKEEWRGSWTFYDGTARADSEWSLFYVMAVTKDEKRGVWERLGLGKVFQSAFRKSGCTWEEIVLG